MNCDSSVCVCSLGEESVGLGPGFESSPSHSLAYLNLDSHLLNICTVHF